MTNLIFSGIALLPDEETSQKIIEFRNSRQDISGPKLGLDTNLPHLSLFQGMYPEDIDPTIVFSQIKRKAQTWDSVKFSKLSWEHGDWVFANVEIEKDILHMHDSALRFSSPVMSAPIVASGIAKWRQVEQDAFYKFGYRYAGKAYQPHITLGSGEFITEAMDEEFQALFSGNRVSFEKAVFYSAGERGVLAEVIHSIDL